MHAQGGIAHERDVYTTGAGVGRFVVAVAVVLCERCGVAYGLTQPHVVEEPVGITRPEVGERTAGCQCGTEEVVRVIPVAEVAAEEDGEHTLRVAAGELRTVANTVGAVPPSTAAAIAPQVRLRAQLGEVVACNGVVRVYQRTKTPPCVLGEGIGVTGEVVIDHGAILRGELLELPLVQLGEVVPQQGGLVRAEGGQVVEINAAHGEFHRSGDHRLIELAIARHIEVARPTRAGTIHAVVRPRPVHFAVVHIGGPRAVMLTVAIGCQIAAHRHGHMAKDQHGLHLRWSSCIVCNYQRLDRGHRCGAAHIVAQHRPSISFKILLHLCQLCGQ